MRERFIRHRGKATLAMLFGGVIFGLAYRLAIIDDEDDIWERSLRGQPAARA